MNILINNNDLKFVIGGVLLVNPATAEENEQILQERKQAIQKIKDIGNFLLYYFAPGLMAVGLFASYQKRKRMLRLSKLELSDTETGKPVDNPFGQHVSGRLKEIYKPNLWYIPSLNPLWDLFMEKLPTENKKS